MKRKQVLSVAIAIAGAVVLCFALSDRTNLTLWAVFVFLVFMCVIAVNFDTIKDFKFGAFGVTASLTRHDVPFSIDNNSQQVAMPAEDQEFDPAPTENREFDQEPKEVRCDFRLPVYCILSKNEEGIDFLVTVTIEEKDRLLMYSHRERAKLYIEEESIRAPDDNITILEISTEQMLLNVLDKMPSSIDEVLWDAVSYRPEFFKFLLIERIRPKKLSEDFSQGRMERAISAAAVIQDNWQKTNQFDYKVTCAEQIEGKSLDELSKLDFAVGIEGNQTHLPLLDMLVLFSYVVAEAEARKKIKTSPEATTYKATVQIKTTFTEEEVRSWLDQIQIDMT
ncbi:MAG: hypothetical protein IID44_10720 [Planctomycetes bacterium]|nr:hypothetical protein [Planctomycetota bacterium]